MHGDSCYEFVQHYGGDSPEGIMAGRWNEITAHEKNIPAVLTEHVQHIISKIFLPERPMQPIPTDIPLESLYCRSPNVHDVQREMRRIADRLEERTGEQVNAGILHFMADTHDCSHAQAGGVDQSHCGNNGRPCDLAQVCGTAGLLKRAWLTQSIEIIENLADYIYNRGFYNTRLSGTGHSEPKSIEWQIVRLASHTGADASAGMRAHWMMGKQFGIPYFQKEISFEDRVSFSFPQIGEYMAAGKVDEFTFFLAFLSLSPKDFQHPVLQDIYREWAKGKNEAIATMLEIAWEEGFWWSDVREMEGLISRYIGHFNLSW